MCLYSRPKKYFMDINKYINTIKWCHHYELLNGCNVVTHKPQKAPQEICMRFCFDQNHIPEHTVKIYHPHALKTNEWH